MRSHSWLPIGTLGAALLLPGLGAASSYQETDGTVVDPILETQAAGGGVHPYAGPNLEPGVSASTAALSDADLSRAALEGAGLSSASFEGARLVRSDLDAADLQNAQLDGADLVGADASSADLSNADLSGARLTSVAALSVTGTGVDLSGVAGGIARLTGQFAGSVWLGAGFRGASLSGSYFTLADLSNADFSLASLREADFLNATVTGTDFRSADLTDAQNLGTTTGAAIYDVHTNFDGTAFSPSAAGWIAVSPPTPFFYTNTDGASSELNFIRLWVNGSNNLILHSYSGPTLGPGASLEGIELDGAYMPSADLSGADLEGASIRMARVPWADLSGANFCGADLEFTELGTDLSGASFCNANLHSAFLGGAGGNLVGVDLSGAFAPGAALQGDMTDANLSGVDLRGGSLSGDLVDVDFSNANLDRTGFSSWTILAGAFQLGSTTGSAIYKQGTDFSGAWHGAPGSTPFDPVAAGWLLDTDGDGVPDAEDNCSAVGNASSNCDTDQDGYGNSCDGDYDQSGTVNSNDFLNFFLPDFNTQVDTGTGTDGDCSGTVNASDFLNHFVDQFDQKKPGPSGLACAGTVPCPTP